MSGQRVGVVGDGALAGAVEAAGGRAVHDDGDAVADVEWFVAAGEDALLELASRPVDAPVLPVDAGDGFQSVPASAIETAIDRVLDGDYGTVEHPVASTGGPDGAGTSPTATSLFDVALVAAEPARISEFEVRCGDDRVDRFRADGVVARRERGIQSCGGRPDRRAG
jgi:NAD+ kinase